MGPRKRKRGRPGSAKRHLGRRQRALAAIRSALKNTPGCQLALAGRTGLVLAANGRRAKRATVLWSDGTVQEDVETARLVGATILATAVQAAAGAG